MVQRIGNTTAWCWLFLLGREGGGRLLLFTWAKDPYFLSCPQLLHASDLVQQARDEDLSWFITTSSLLTVAT